jgi:uncharacterized protein
MSLTALETRIFEAVRSSLAGYDASHDIAHIQRVLANANSIATADKATPAVLTVVRLAALLHDVGDSKYAGSESAEVMISKILQEQGVDEKLSEAILTVVDRVSFHKEIEGAALPPLEADVAHALAIVQDADRLDAIGAIGIARCFCFGGARNRPLYDDKILDPAVRKDLLERDLSVEEYKKASENTIGHFYAKLLKLKSMMKTEAGRKIAEQRHQAMEAFCEQFFAEIAGER